MGNSAWEGSEITKVRVDVDRVVVTQGLRVWFVGGGEISVGAYMRYQKGLVVLHNTVTLQVCGDRIADRDTV